MEYQIISVVNVVAMNGTPHSRQLCSEMKKTLMEWRWMGRRYRDGDEETVGEVGRDGGIDGTHKSFIYNCNVDVLWDRVSTFPGLCVWWKAKSHHLWTHQQLYSQPLASESEKGPSSMYIALTPI